MSEAVSKHVHLSRGSIGPFVGGEHECEACLARESALAAARAELDALRRDYDVLREGYLNLARETTGDECEPGCNADRHEENCKLVSPEVYVKALNARIALLEGVLRTEPDVVAQEAWGFKTGMYTNTAIKLMTVLRARAALDGGRDDR